MNQISDEDRELLRQFGHLSKDEVDKLDRGDKVNRNIINNNPGNIEDGKFAKSQPGYVRGDGRFAIFERPEDGFRAQQALLRKNYSGRSIAQIIAKYAPPSENDTAAYVRYVSNQTGFSADHVPQGDDFIKIAHAMNKHEGGVEYDPETVMSNAPAPVRAEAPADPNADRSQNNFMFNTGEMRVNNAQQAAFQQMLKDGKLDPKAEVGSASNPYGVTTPETIANIEPGKFYIDLDGQTKQRPGDLEYDQKLGLWRGASRVLDNASVALESGLNVLGTPFGNNHWADDVQHALGGSTAKEVRAERDAAFAEKARQGIMPGGVGRFIGETLPMMAIPALRGVFMAQIERWRQA